MRKVKDPIRIIPRLDVKGPNLVKGVNLEGLRVLGPPDFFSKAYFQSGADELLYVDIVASLYGRNNLEEIVKKTARNIHIPITVAGGIKNINDIRRILLAGADKVAINTAAINSPNLITEGATFFGSQCIVVSIEAVSDGKGSYEALTENGRERTGRDVFEWAKMVEELGAGEILITSVDKEGTGQGFDIDLIGKICQSINIPVIACGGAGSWQDIAKIIEHTDVDAVSAASIFHYQIVKEYREAETADGNPHADIIQLDRIPPQFDTLSIDDVKRKLGDNCINVVSHGSAEQTTHLYLKKKSPKIMVIDYGRSNLFSVCEALTSIKADFFLSDDPNDTKNADKIILAGVGAFNDGMRVLHDKGFAEEIRNHSSKSKAILGICLGMQMFMDKGEEHGTTEGLGLIAGDVRKLENTFEPFIKIPHIGWSRLFPPENQRGGDNKVVRFSGLLNSITDHDFFYFNHSFIVEPGDASHIAAITVYGKNEFCSVVRKDNIFGCQFHPERSGHTGLAIYHNFISC